jgi:hypothetical protein
MSGKTYDVLKYIAQIVLPAIATLYFTLAQIWGLPYAEQIVGTITAIDTFLGVLLKISTNYYEKTVPEYLDVKQQYEDRIEAGEFDDVDYSEGE